MGLLDFVTGGKNKDAQNALNNILAQIQGIQTPTADQLQLSDLAQYSNAGNLDAALGTAAQAGPSAFNNENLSSVPTATMQQVLAKEGEISNAQGMTPQERAQIAQAEEAMNTGIAGQRGAIAQDFAQRGTPQSLISAALQNASVGQNAQQAYQSALQAEGQAADRGQTALQNQGALAGQMFNQQAGQANTVAAAQNALNQFNTANTQQSNLANQANKQAANTYNTQNAQNVSNQNVLGKQDVQKQNQIYAPQQAASLALQKGSELSGIGQAEANLSQNQANQSAGLFSGLLGTGASLASGIIGANTGDNIANAILKSNTPTPTGIPTGSSGGEVFKNIPATNFKAGGPVPGVAERPGNSPENDTVPALLSPGEVVLPRTVVQNPAGIGHFLNQKVPAMAQKISHSPSDIASVIKALTLLRQGA